MYLIFWIHWSLLVVHNNMKLELYIYPYLVEIKISQSTIILRPFLGTNQIWIGYYTTNFSAYQKENSFLTLPILLVISFFHSPSTYLVGFRCKVKTLSR